MSQDKFHPQDPTQLYRMCLDRWGSKAQLIMLMEECGELIQVAAKLLNNRCDSLDDLVDELADVAIMIEQVTTMFNLERSVSKRVRQKQDRLLKLLLEAKRGTDGKP